MRPSPGAELLRQIAVPRLAGSPALDTVTDLLERRLAELPFSVERHTFTASARRLSAAGVAGAGLGGTALVVGPLLAVSVAAWAVALVGGGALALALLLAHGVAQGYLPVGPPVVRAVNLVARRVAAPRVWLVAHLDSKSQRLSLRARVLAVLTAALGSALLLGALAARFAGPLPWWVVVAAVALTAAGGAALSAAAPGNASPGAVDNASGVLAALVAAERLGDRPDVGVLLTSAEESGMEGARAWIRERAPGGRFINFDGIDGRGAFHVMRHRAGPDDARGLSAALSGALQAAGAAVRERRLPPGILVDGVVLSRAGMPGVTLSRGDWETLGVIHTPHDTVHRVDLAAVVAAGEAAAEAVRRVAS